MLTALIRAGVVQFEHVAGDKNGNFRKIESICAQAAERHVRLLAFPECCITGYWFLRNLSRKELTDLAEPVPDGVQTDAYALGKAVGSCGCSTNPAGRPLRRAASAGGSVASQVSASNR